MKGLLLGLCLSCAGFPAFAGDLDKAPPPFGFRADMAVPADFESVHIDYLFDYARSTASAVATVVFSTGQDGLPMLDLVPNPTYVALNGNELPVASLVLMDDPHQVTRLRILDQRVAAGQSQTLEIRYNLSSSVVTFSGGAVRSGFFMSDLTSGGRAFFEKYGPASFEFDQVRHSFNVEVTGVTKSHVVQTNGIVTSTGGNSWNIVFPSYFTSSSPYFHLYDSGRFVEQSYEYAGLSARIPVVVYAESSSLVQSGVSRSRSVMQELEQTYGPYAHEKMVIYVTPSGGGMEYGGATMTSLGALGHEMTHFWFARGVMPADGNSGWIDEAIASWRDNGCPRASGAPNRSPVNLGGFSPYRRHTTSDAYTLGARLISEFDYMFSSQGGMKAILRQMFAEHQRSTITLPMFRDFMESVTGADLERTFARYVLGQSRLEDTGPESAGTDDGFVFSSHPRPYTGAELEQFR